MQIFVEANAIAERVDDLHAPRAVKSCLDPGPQIFVVPVCDLAMKFVDARHPYENRRAGTGVAVVLRKMQREPGPRNLHVRRRVLLEMVLPIESKTEEIDVKFFRLDDIEDPQDGNRSEKGDGHHSISTESTGKSCRSKLSSGIRPFEVGSRSILFDQADRTL